MNKKVLDSNNFRIINDIRNQGVLTSQLTRQSEASYFRL